MARESKSVARKFFLPIPSVPPPRQSASLCFFPGRSWPVHVPTDRFSLRPHDQRADGGRSSLTNCRPTDTEGRVAETPQSHLRKSAVSAVASYPGRKDRTRGGQRGPQDVSKPQSQLRKSAESAVASYPGRKRRTRGGQRGHKMSRNPNPICGNPRNLRLHPIWGAKTMGSKPCPAAHSARSPCANLPCPSPSSIPARIHTPASSFRPHPH